MPLYARAPSALHASSQSRTFVVPAAVQTVIDPSPLQVASVPEHGGKHVSSTGEVEDVSSAQLALESASAQAPVTRIAVNWRVHVSVVTACPHSVMRRLQSFSALIGRRPLVPLPDDDVAPELELLAEEERGARRLRPRVRLTCDDGDREEPQPGARAAPASSSLEQRAFYTHRRQPARPRRILRRRVHCEVHSVARLRRSITGGRPG